MEDGSKHFRTKRIRIPNERRLFFTPTKHNYSKQVERTEMWKKMGEGKKA